MRIIKKQLVFFIFIFLCSFVYGQNKICLSNESLNLVAFPPELSQNFDLSSFFECYSFLESKPKAENGSYCVFSKKSAGKMDSSNEKTFLSQLIFISKDSTKFTDLLYISEEDYYIPQISWKNVYGREYIKFDENGRLFIAVLRKSTNQSGIFMYSSLENTSHFFPLPESFSKIIDFDISSDGRFVVVSGDNGIQNFRYQAFLFDTENSSSTPVSLFYMNSQALSSVIFSPENQAFYMIAAFCDEKLPDSERCRVAVLRKKNDIYSRESLQYIPKSKVSNGKSIDFYFNIFVKNETDNKLYATNYKDPSNQWPGTLYEIIDENDYILTKEPESTRSIKFVNTTYPVYKISLKATPFGIFLKDKDDKVYLFKEDVLTSWSDDVAAKEIQSYNEKLYQQQFEKPVIIEEVNQEEVEKNVTTEKIQDKQFTKTMTIIFVMLILIIVCLLIIIILLLRSMEQNYKKILQKKILAIQESDRAKLSRDIHDSVVQDIRAIRIQTEMIDVGENQDAQLQKMHVINEVTQTIKKMRNICYNLTPAELVTHQENADARVELISVIDTLCQQFYLRAKIPCSIQIADNLVYPSFDKEITLQLVRIFQEILNNIEKHSYATNVNVMIRNKTEENITYLVIFVIDDGIGCNIEQKLKSQKKNHFGLTNMKERMKLVGGQIEFFSSENQGMKIKLTVKI